METSDTRENVLIGLFLASPVLYVLIDLFVAHQPLTQLAHLLGF